MPKGVYDRTPEMRARKSAAMKGKGLGRRLPIETRTKISAALKGNTNTLGYRHTSETRAKMSETHKGHAGASFKHTPEARAKIVIAGTGRKHSQEARDKMSGENNYRFRSVGSTYQHAGTYVMVKTNNGWQPEHRVIMGLQPGDPRVVHHIDQNKENNDPANLQIFDSQGAHIRHHNLLDISKEGVR